LRQAAGRRLGFGPAIIAPFAAAVHATSTALGAGVIVRPVRSRTGRKKMATYIVLVNWTSQGVRDVKESPKRLDAARELAKKLGMQIKEFYMVMGTYDAVLVAEAPDDAAMAKFNLSVAARGNVRTTTLKTFSEAEYRKITAGVV
jgi:uncharacterized protein with GYD domain